MCLLFVACRQSIAACCARLGAFLAHDVELHLGVFPGRHVIAHASLRSSQSLRQAAAWLMLWITQIAIVLSTMAVVTFEGAYAVLAHVANQTVQQDHQITAREMLGGFAMAGPRQGAEHDF